MSSIEPGPSDIAPALFSKTSRPRSILFWLVSLLGMAALIVAVLHFGSPERLAALARSVRPGWLLLAVLLQATGK